MPAKTLADQAHITSHCNTIPIWPYRGDAINISPALLPSHRGNRLEMCGYRIDLFAYLGPKAICTILNSNASKVITYIIRV